MQQFDPSGKRIANKNMDCKGQSGSTVTVQIYYWSTESHIRHFYFFLFSIKMNQIVQFLERTDTPNAKNAGYRQEKFLQDQWGTMLYMAPPIPIFILAQGLRGALIGNTRKKIPPNCICSSTTEFYIDIGILYNGAYQISTCNWRSF